MVGAQVAWPSSRTLLSMISPAHRPRALSRRSALFSGLAGQLLAWDLFVILCRRQLSAAWPLRSGAASAIGSSRLLLPAFRVDDRGYRAGVDVVDVPGDTDVLRDFFCLQHLAEIGLHSAGRVQDGRVGQGPLVGADALGRSRGAVRRRRAGWSGSRCSGWSRPRSRGLPGSHRPP